VLCLPSPSLEWVHASAGLSGRLRTWLTKACENYGELLAFEGIVNATLRKDRLEELAGEQKTRFAEALREYDKLIDGLSRFAKLKSFTDFVSYTDENLFKWVGDEIVSLGYCGFREKSSQYWLWDLRLEKLPLDRKGEVVKVRQVLEFYMGSRRIYGLSIPSQEQAEGWLFEFLENVKKWPRDRLLWLVRNCYPLSDDTGGFWTLVRKVMELETLRDAWQDIIEDWTRSVQDSLKKMPEFEVLKTVLTSEWEAEKYLRDLAEDLETQFLDKYGNVIADKEKVKEEFYDRAPQFLKERVAPEEKLREVYEQLKTLVPPDKVELTRAGLWKAIRWAFLHPQISLEAFASVHIWPLGVFTTEQAKAIAARIIEKAPKKLVPAVKLTGEESSKLADYFLGMLRTAGVSLPTQYKSEFEKAMDITKTYEENLPLIQKVAEDIIKRVAPPTKALPTIRAYWGKSPRDLPALWVEVYVEDKLKLRGHLEVARQKKETLERTINEKIKESIREAGLPEDILLVDPLLRQTSELTKILLETAPAEVLVEAKVLTDQDVYMVLPPAKETPISFEALRQELKKQQFDVYSPQGEKRLRDILASLEKEGSIYEPRPGTYRWTEEVEEVAPPPPKIELMKIRFLKDMPAIVGADFKVYGPFAKGDVVELPNVNADVIVKQEIATYMIAPPELPAKEIDALRTVVKVKADDLGLAWADEVWSRFWKEYEARARELWTTKKVTYVEEEVENVLRAVGMPITPPAVRRERVRRPPTVGVPVEAPAEVFVTPVTIPKLPMSKLPFPRAPSTEEQAVLWDAFRYEMARLGHDPFRWRDNFKMHVLNRPYPDWATVLKNFNEFIDAIRTEKPFRLLPLVTLPMPWSEEEEQRKHDAILHFIATKLYPSMDELIHALYTFGVEVTEDDVKKAVRKGFAEKNLWFTSVSKEMLESLIAEKL